MDRRGFLAGLLASPALGVLRNSTALGSIATLSIGKVQSADGGWWELAESVVTPSHFGAVGDDTAVLAGHFGTDGASALYQRVI